MSDRTRRREPSARRSWSDVAEADTPEAGRGEAAASNVADERAAGSPELDAEHAAEAELGQQLDALQSELGALNDRYLRLAAEFQNYRRRAESEMSETWGRAQADLVRRFLDVLDDLQRVAALEPNEKVNVQSIMDGVDLVERKMLRALQDSNVEVLTPDGQPFDPATMEAVMTVPADSAEDDERVHQVFQNGYKLKGHLIRPARVSVKKRD
jgi:molecular chaperone GrpE